MSKIVIGESWSFLLGQKQDCSKWQKLRNQTTSFTPLPWQSKQNESSSCKRSDSRWKKSATSCPL